MDRPLLRRAVALALPAWACAVLLTGVAYLDAQQALRMGANDPQVQLAEDAAAALDAGAAPASVVGTARVDVARSLAPFVVVYDAAGSALASGGTLDGSAPVPPAGVLAAAAARGSDRVTWQPRAGVRIATVVVAWSGGTVLAGRSLREVEARVDQLTALDGLALLAGLLAIGVAALVAAWLWPAGAAGGAMGSGGDRAGRDPA